MVAALIEHAGLAVINGTGGPKKNVLNVGKNLLLIINKKSS